MIEGPIISAFHSAIYKCLNKCLVKDETTQVKRHVRWRVTVLFGTSGQWKLNYIRENWM